MKTFVAALMLWSFARAEVPWAAEAGLEVGGAVPRGGRLTLSELEAMAPVTVSWTAGKTRHQVRGVSVHKVLEHFGFTVGRMSDDQSKEQRSGWRRAVVASAEDGFEAVFSSAELIPEMGATRALVAWQIDGKPLAADRGPLRLVVLSDRNPSRSVYALRKLVVVNLGAAVGPGTGPSGHGHHGGQQPPAAAPHPRLARVTAIHGAAGPFAVAGQRMGERALRDLGLAAGSFDLEVRHEAPAEVQWSCIADGAQAATGASTGKLNLKLQAAPREAMRTVFRRKSTGQSLVFRLKPEFVRRYLDLPPGELMHAGHSVLDLRDEEIFSLVRP